MRRDAIRPWMGWLLATLLVCAALAPLVSRWLSPAPATGVEALGEAFESQRSDLWVEAQGEVVKLLSDDLDGSRHQRFILRLDSGQTLLVAHNIDLASRLEGLSPRDPVDFRGEYVWNARGGIIHWTHRDPQGRIPGGWLEWNGQRYR